MPCSRLHIYTPPCEKMHFFPGSSPNVCRTGGDFIYTFKYRMTFSRLYTDLDSPPLDFVSCIYYIVVVACFVLLV